MKTLAMLVGGGPAPGINAVIAAATIEARNSGVRVLGCQDGDRWLMRGDVSRVEKLHIEGLSRIHFEGGSVLRTSRANPTRSPDALRQVVETGHRRGRRAARAPGRTVFGLIGWAVWAWLIYFIGTRLLPEPATQANTGELQRAAYPLRSCHSYLLRRRIALGYYLVG